MQFLKAHYEKIILSIVLLGLAAAAALMPIKVSKERDLAGERENSIVNRPVTPMKPVDLTTNALILARMEQPDFPQPVGVFRAVERPSYDQMLSDQIETAIAKSSPGTLEKLIYSGDMWTVE